ncbi:MAG: penicillin-binding protein 2 [Pseudomonadota bacterium]
MSLFGRKKLHMMGVRNHALEQARGRIVLMSVVFVCAYLIIIARSIDVMALQGTLYNHDEAQYFQQEIQKNEEMRRADIIDRNGVLLARSLRTASLHADPKMVKEPEDLAQSLHTIFPQVQYGTILQKLQSKKRFVWVKRNITPEEQSQILKLGSPALNFKYEDRRLYPQGEQAIHMVGYSGIDGQGLSGVEASFNDFLGNSDKPLALTLDIRLQHALKREIQNSIETFSAKGGAGVIMNVNDGSVLAAVSLPDFDPQDYKNAKADEKFNRTTLGVYELGSVFKIFSTAALLEITSASMGKAFDAREPIKVGRFQIRDYHAEKRIMSLPEVFMHSSNIGSALMGEEVGNEPLKKFYADLGLLHKANFEIKEIGSPLVPDPWGDVHTLTASYGHGIAVSPLQMTSAVASIVNGGYFVEPTLILNKAQKDTNKTKEKTNLRIVSPEVSHRMRQLLRLVVTNGTGSSADVEGYLVGGKTGTAEKPGAGGYDRKRLISSFIGVFPMNEPQYAIYVMIDEPQGTKESYGYATGGWVAAPVVKKVVQSMASVLNISPQEKEQGIESSLLRYVKTKEEIEQEKEQTLAAF